MSKVDNPEAVKYAIQQLINRKPTNTESNYDSKLPVVAYYASQAVGKRITYAGISRMDLQNALAGIPDVEYHFDESIINVCGEFFISINSRYEPAIYIRNTRQIHEAQNNGEIGRYTAIDNDVIFTNSTLHCIPAYRKWIEFACKNEVTIEDAVALIKDTYDIVSKYAPVFQNFDEFIENIPHTTPSTYRDESSIDISKYFIKCDHTALKTGAWDE